KQELEFSVQFAPTEIWSVLVRYFAFYLSCDVVFQSPLIRLKSGWIVGPLGVWLFSASIGIAYRKLLMMGFVTGVAFAVSTFVAGAIWFIVSSVVNYRRRQVAAYWH